jgi:hypothetical protein
MIVSPVVCSDFKSLVNMLPPLDLETGPWIAGGAARKLFQHQNWKKGDVDVFFRDPQQFVDWVAQFDARLVEPIPSHEHLSTQVLDESHNWLCLFNTRHKKAVIKNKFYLAHQTANAHTYKMPGEAPLDGITVQMIRARWGETLQDVWKTFDMHVCDFATDGETILCTPKAFEAVMEGEIGLKEDADLKNLSLRVLKYHLHGFSAPKHVLKICVSKILAGEIEWNTTY